MTLVELVITVLLVALLVATVAPAYVKISESRRQRDFMHTMRVIVADAREHAISSGMPAALRVDANALSLVQVGEEDETTIRRLTLLDGVRLERLRVAGAELSEADWRVTFYPDGSTDGGDIRFSRGNTTHTLTIDAYSGRSFITAGEAEDEEDEWSAGGYERRF